MPSLHHTCFEPGEYEVDLRGPATPSLVKQGPYWLEYYLGCHEADCLSMCVGTL